jgi:hypothetical protein
MPRLETTSKQLNDFAPGEALKLLHALRDRLVDAAANTYAAHIKDAKEDMQQLAQRASDEPRRELYAAGHALLSNGALALLNRFRDTYCRACDQAVAALSGDDADVWDVASELTLVDANAFERDLAVARLSAKAQYACSQQLTALDRRVAALLGLKRLDSDANPFSTKRLFTALVDAAEASWAGSQLALVLLETFEHYTAKKLPEVYQELNEFLVDKGVLPKLPVEIEERERELERRERDVDAIGDVFVQLASGLMEGQSGCKGSSPAADLAGGGRAGMGSGGGMQGGDFGGAGSGGGTGEGGGIQGRMAPMVMSQFIDGLTGLQRGRNSAADKLGVDLDSVNPESSSVLRSLSASPLLRWLQPNDAVTIELVANLFDCIFSDAEVPKKLRGEIGKLQVPVLKVALMNKGFFSDHRHPARRLIDVMAAAARGWTAGDEQELLSSISDAVEKVLNGFETDTSVFNRQAERIEAVLKDAERSARGHVSDLVQRLEQRDRKQIAETIVEDQIRRRVQGVALQAPVESFINHHWRDLLARIYIKFGDTSSDWDEAVSTLEDLIWSVQPKTTPDDRMRMMQLLPGLLERLPAALKRLGRANVWEGFLAELMPLHMSAIKQDAAPETDESARRSDDPVEQAASRADEASPSMRQGVARFGSESQAQEDAASSEGMPWIMDADSSLTPHAETGESEGTPVSALDAELLQESEPTPEPVDPDLLAAQQVELGDWLEVRTLDGSNLSLRASWRSHQSGMILFADRRGRNAQVLSTERLAEALKQRTARLLSRDPLTDRAVAKLLVNSAPREEQVA